MPKLKAINPFYVALLPAGVLFALSACAFTVATVRGQEPGLADESPVMQFLDRYGLWLLVAELLVLGIFTVAAIASDEYWTKKAG